VHSLFFQLFVLNCPVLSKNLEKLEPRTFYLYQKVQN